MFHNKTVFLIIIGILIGIIFLDLYMQPIISAQTNGEKFTDRLHDYFYKTKLKLKPSDYVEWFSDPMHQFVQEEKYHDMRYKVLYKPKEYVICMEERTNDLSSTCMKNKLLAMQGFEYFDLQISLLDSSKNIWNHQSKDSVECDKQLNYFSFDMEKDIYLVSKQDTFSCQMFHFERSNGLTPYYQFLMGFAISSSQAQTGMELIIRMHSWQKGYLYFTFDKSIFVKKPELLTVN